MANYKYLCHAECMQFKLEPDGGVDPFKVSAWLSSVYTRLAALSHKDWHISESAVFREGEVTWDGQPVQPGHAAYYMRRVARALPLYYMRRVARTQPLYYQQLTQPAASVTIPASQKWIVGGTYKMKITSVQPGQVVDITDDPVGESKADEPAKIKWREFL